MSRNEDRRGRFVVGFNKAGEYVTDEDQAVNAMYETDLAGYCSSRHHNKCAFRAGGPQEHGVHDEAVPGVYEAWTWLCGCQCHDEHRARTAALRNRRAKRKDRSIREDGEDYTTKVVEIRNCEVCGADIQQRAEGRRRRFCGAACRVRHARMTPKLF